MPQFRYITVKQPIGEFYVVALPSSFVNTISYSQERKRKQNDFTSYFGIERPLRPDRVRQISHYVRGTDATFPTAVILAFDEESERGQVTRSTEHITIPEEPNIAEIVDGQHRLAGLDMADNPEFDVLCSIFINFDLADKAHIFATINLEQRKVNPSLAMDLLAYAESASPNKSLHEIVVQLNESEKSPLYRRVKRLGVVEAAGETLSQSTFVKEMARLVTRQELEDRTARQLGRSIPHAFDLDRVRMPFRNLWIDQRDDSITTCIFRYFLAASKVWPDAWVGDYPMATSVLVKTAGFSGLTKAFPTILSHLNFSEDTLPSTAEYADVFHDSGLDDEFFRSANVDPGTSGQNVIRDAVLKKIGPRV